MIILIFEFKIITTLLLIIKNLSRDKLSRVILSQVKIAFNIEQFIIIKSNRHILRFSRLQLFHMDKNERHYTPSRLNKQSEIATTSQTYIRNQKTSEQKRSTQLRSDTNYLNSRLVQDAPIRQSQRENMTLMREYETMRIQIRQLQARNRQLQAQVQKVIYQKSYNEKQFQQKLSFQSQTLNQFQKQKNYQMELINIKNQEELSRLRRQYDVQLDQLQKQIKNRDYLNREKIQEINYLQIRTSQLKKQLENVQRQLIKARQNNSILNEQLTKEQFSNKKLSMLCQEVERQRNQMETQIHVLLDIQAQKSRAINSLEVQLCNSQSSERALQQKLTILTENFSNLQAHITLMKERLLQSDSVNSQLQKTLQVREFQVREKERQLLEQKQHQLKVHEQLQDQRMRQTRRQKQVQELMEQNQRLYRELNRTRHQLHQICIQKGIDL